MIQQHKHDTFQYGKRTGKYLANQLQHRKEKEIITTIITSRGETTEQDKQEINKTFLQTYTPPAMKLHNHKETQTKFNDRIKRNSR